MKVNDLMPVNIAVSFRLEEEAFRALDEWSKATRRKRAQLVELLVTDMLRQAKSNGHLNTPIEQLIRKLQSVPLEGAVLCDHCQRISGSQDGRCPICGSVELINLNLALVRFWGVAGTWPEKDRRVMQIPWPIERRLKG